MVPLRDAVRALWTRPQLSLAAVALLALGVGANTTLFALADAVMFRPFPFADQDRLVVGGGMQAGHRAEIPYPDFVDWRTRAHSFDDLAAMASSNWTGTLQAAEPLPLAYRAVSGNFFDVPLLTLRSSRLEQVLRDGGRTATGNRQNRRTRRLLVVAEIAIAVVILTGAALLYRSVASLTRLDVGFVADRLVATEVHAPSVQAADRTTEHQFYTRVIDALRTLPSVESVAGVAGRPLKGPIGLDSSWQRDGQDVEEAKRNPWANLEAVTPGYFATMGIRLLEGRAFTDDDRMETAPVAIVGETFARRTWPGMSAIGKRLRGHGFDERRVVPPWWTVVGVVADVRYRDLRSPSLDVYVPYDQGEFSIGDVVIRTRGPAPATIAAIHARLRSVDPDGAIRIALMRNEIAREQTPWRADLLFFGFFAALTAFIAIVGLYGLFASVVAEQGHELGVRLALGATARQVVSEVMGAAGRTALIGTALGLLAAAAAGRVVQAMLFGVSPQDAVALTIAPAVILVLAVTASLIPARRAARIDPIVSLRAE